MSGGGSSSKQTTSGSSTPWKPAQSGLKYGIGEAENLYKSGIGAQAYTGSTVVPYAEQTTNAMDNIMAKSDMAQGGMIKPFNSISSQIDTLSPIAQGDFSNDTTFNQTLGRAQEDAAHQVNLGASAAGRYGSAIHQGNVAREVGDFTNRAMLDRQRWAQDGLMQASSALPQAYQSAFMPEQSQMAIGSMYEDLMGRQMQDQARIFNEQQNLPWDNLARYNAILSGAGELGGNQKSTVSQPKDYSSAFGNAMTGYAYGKLPGAALGGLSGLF
jgi:hypothetical protein